ncbi:uncharacterized protein LOC110037237 [Phalaenopsis equestris]|uniref:uncharacterized protein LOC110037237 n=1 Tax=Phalaenopsis equestris TaxID=78828 RepID=UPI0009E4FEA6|nr:uncharacterized protein LOC110037237 [Phalaenopsis equestris]
METHMDTRRRKQRGMFLTAICLIYEYYNTYIDRSPCMTSSYIGDKWVGELLAGHPTRFCNMFRMTQAIFIDLLDLLVGSHGLHGSSRTNPREVLAITLFILSQNESMRGAMERFQHSSETISRYFSIGLSALVSLSSHVIRASDYKFEHIPAEIARDARYMPFFKDCIGAIDGTHVDARIPNSDKVAFIGRCGSTTQNVMAVCDFNMCFTFVMAGWEGSAHDSRIFKSATRDPKSNFPHPPAGKYYLVDAGYPMQRGYLKPFPDTRYHIPDFARASNVTRGRNEIFNKRHSSLRGVIERTFGVWKKKWVILRDMPPYNFSKQVQIVFATMALHNYIRRHHSRSDIDFHLAELDEENVPSETFEYRLGQFFTEEETEASIAFTVDGEGASEMAELRERIVDEIACL